MWKLATFLVTALFLSACSTSTETSADDVDPEEPHSLRINPLNPDKHPSPETPPPERIASLIQEAGQQYDDRHFPMAMRLASQAESHIREHKFSDKDLVLAINIQGFCLLQSDLLEEYFVRDYGRQPGALDKFDASLKINPESLRALIGIGLTKFRLHAGKLRKSDAVAEGLRSLEDLQQEIRLAAKADNQTALKSLADIRRRLTVLISNRDRLLKMESVFRDISRSTEMNEERAKHAPWLPTLKEGVEALKLQDASFALDDAILGKKLDASAAAAIEKNLKQVADSWSAVHQYWRMDALKDLQASRDQLLKVRKTDPWYFWVERDLVFVYQSLGAYFLDIGLEQARKLATAQATPPDRLPRETERIYLSKDFDTWEKRESKANYKVALEFTKSFVRLHQKVEQDRINRRDAADYSDETANPFHVDLAVRFRATMDEIIVEELDLRSIMVLEAAALCIEPLFQINDVREAETWATQLQASKPGDPIHHFVRATAYFNNGQYEDALDSYNAYLKESSPTEDENRRKVSRDRRRECESRLSRAGNAGEDSSG